MVPHDNIGPPEVMTDIGFNILRAVQEKVLTDQFSGRRHLIGFGPASGSFAIGLGDKIGQGQAAVENLLLGDKGLDVGQALEIGRIPESAFGIGIKGDVKDVDTGQFLMHAVSSPYHGAVLPKEGERIVGNAKTGSHGHPGRAGQGHQKQTGDHRAMAHQTDHQANKAVQETRNLLAFFLAEAFSQQAMEQRMQQEGDQSVAHYGQHGKQRKIPHANNPRESLAGKSEDQGQRCDQC